MFTSIYLGMNSLNDEFKEKLYEMQNQYFEKTSKNILFKKQQKNDCAMHVFNQVSLDELVNKTVYSIPNTNRVLFDYTIFKTFANDSIYPHLVEKALFLYQKAIDEYGNFQMHVNLDTYTVSGCERTKGIFYVLFEKCPRPDNRFSKLLEKLCIYNTPNVMDMIVKIMLPLIDPIVKPKIVMFNKKESGDKIMELFSLKNDINTITHN